MHRPTLLPSLLLTLSCTATQVNAQEDLWGLCQPLPAATLPAAPLDGLLRMEADKAFGDQSGGSTLEGDVLLRRDNQRLSADRATYHHAEGRAEATGNVVYEDTEVTIRGSAAEVRFEQDRARFVDADYRIHALHARGDAMGIEQLSPTLYTLESASYTTCDAGREAWLLSGKQVRLDRERGEGTARDVTLRFQGVPILYTPWIRFPIDDQRRSGVLLPRFGGSDKTGLDIEIPYYWNIAPNYDATLGARLLGSRGLMARGEFRYLIPRGEGTLNLDYLPDDREYGEARHQVAWQHRGPLTRSLWLDVDVNDVSDAAYFQDLGNSLDVASTTHLERRADLRYAGTLANGHWSLLGRAQGYQTIDPRIAGPSRPYQRLPQLLFDGRWGGHTELHLRGEWVRFEREDSLTGNRLDLYPELSLPWRRPGWHLVPGIGYRYTQYDLDPLAPVTDERPSRGLPVVSVDGGLHFERRTGNGLQTLEPRLYYLYVPQRDQDDLPIFDTGRLDFGFDQLFRNERFSGADRMGDANQLTAALTTRLLDASGQERLRAGIGQVFHFEDREVTLPGEDPDTTGRSSLVAEAQWRPAPHWLTRATLVWNEDAELVDKGVAQVQYRPGGGRVVNLAYRHLDQALEQTDLSFAWPLGPRWGLVGRWNYSLQDRRDLELLAGVEHESCCWRLAVVARRYVTDDGGAYNNGVYFQLTLKGLTSLGNRIGDLLGDGIPGYEQKP
ncbi:MAG: LPS assembly protein LptD [Chromatiales bacterium]|jgi:LPS-assembly protein|nr:LPS assembly protein LptD [Chromatiales bacterium]MDX9768407.1 LPS assembly protein LptD [Ectothiorhodospiraceae bacterium]